MALTSIRPLTDEFPLAYPFDPAFELDRYRGKKNDKGEVFDEDSASKRYLADYQRCVELGDFSSITLPGQRATIFWCRAITGTERRHISGLRPALQASYVFRLALCRVDDAGSDLEQIDRSADAVLPELGKMATVKYVNRLEVLDGLVDILAVRIWERSRTASPP